MIQNLNGHFSYLLILTTFILILFSSCTDNEVERKPLIGTWEIEDIDNEDYKDYLVFDSKNEVFKFRIFNQEEVTPLGAKGTFHQRESVIQIVFDSNGIIYNYILNNGMLILEDGEESIILNKVGDFDFALIPNL